MRHRSFRCTPGPDPLVIPDELRTTLRGRYVSQDDANVNEKFLLYSGQGGRLLVFCAKTELAAMYRSKYLICDGTFEMSPDSSYQLYTMHGYIREEGMALLWAILPNKTQATYVELFTAVRQALIESFGDIGEKRTFLTDFELAAINAVREVFPEPATVVKGCSFHFRQAILRRVGTEGLKTAYNTGDGSNQLLRRWIRQIMGMTLLPAFTVPLAWEFVKDPPITGIVDLDLKAKKLQSYIDSTWINGDFAPSLWSHFDNSGPRTTNLAEGWHNSLKSRFGMPHPSMRNFLLLAATVQPSMKCNVVHFNWKLAERRSIGHQLTSS